MGAILTEWLHEAGVTTRMGAEVERFERGRPLGLGGRREVIGDVTVVAAGIVPAVGLAEAAGPGRGGRPGVTDASMRTSADRVFAAGDIALAENPTAGRRLPVEHWGEALTQGEVAGRALAGEDGRWEQAPGFWSTIGERTLKYVGLGRRPRRGPARPRRRRLVHAWYGQDGAAVGVLTHERDDDYERGRTLVEGGAPLP